MPLAWVPLQLQISRLKSENVQFITKADLMEINRKNDSLSLSELEFERFLKVQQSLGKLVYFESHPFNVERKLDKYVIIQTPALVNVLRSFITDEIFWPKKRKLRQIFCKLSQCGEISRKDLLKLWRQKPFDRLLPGDDVKEYIIYLFIHLDILVEPKRKDCSTVNSFLVPSMVKNVDNTPFFNETNIGQKTICLSFRLKLSGVPTALSFKLIGSALSIWPFKQMKHERRDFLFRKTVMRPCLFNNSAILCVDDDTELRLKVEDERIVVYLTNKTSMVDISPDIAASIQECLTSNLKRALLFYHSNMGKNIRASDIDKLFEREVGYVCQESHCLLPLSEVVAHNTDLSWKCGEKHDRKHALYWVFDKVGFFSNTFRYMYQC